ncbi:MAG: FKBP-type peptidyl-prolyl cis-trans isomerase [Methylococcaceae bacterium]
MTKIQFISIITALIIGITMFSIANATSPAENKAEGTAFLVENAKKANIVTTASGLQYEILIPGTGTATPSATDNVTVHYKGSTLNGKEFDSSYSRGEPTSFPLNRVIAGWTEGVQLMTVGAKYRFYIPAALAYGSQGAGPISPNSTLIFEVELVKIK